MGTGWYARVRIVRGRINTHVWQGPYATAAEAIAVPRTLAGDPWREHTAHFTEERIGRACNRVYARSYRYEFILEG
jgi:hypothetical protein